LWLQISESIFRNGYYQPLKDQPTMAMVELMLDDALIEAVVRRARKDGVTFRDIVVHALESAVAVRDLLDQEPESRPEGWEPLYDGPGLTADELHMQMALKRKP
jgi:hypothetical protein